MRVFIFIVVAESLILMLWLIHWYNSRGPSKPAIAVVPRAVPAINRYNR